MYTGEMQGILLLLYIDAVCNNIIIIVITSRHSYVALYGKLYKHEMSLVCILLSM